MLSAFRKSRGYGKFTRNRWAMFAMSIILVYLVVAAWIFVLESINAAGKATGAFDFSDQPVLGALMAERTAERVAPRWVPGFGLSQSDARRLDQADFILSFAQTAAKQAERAPTPDEQRAALQAREFRLGERRMADVPFTEFQARLADAQASFADLDQGKRRRAEIAKAAKALDRVGPLLTQWGESAKLDPAALGKLRGDLAAGLEELSFIAQDYAKLAPKDDPLAAFDGLPLEDAAAGLEKLAPAASPVEVSVLEAYKAALVKADQAIPTPGGEKITDIEAAVEKLMPTPTGFAGAVYTLRLSLGTDAQGRSILVRGIYSAKVAIQVGVIVALGAVLFGSLLGAAAAYFGGWVDHAVTWLYSTLSSLPQLVLLAVLTFMFLGSAVENTLIPIYFALGMTFWIGPCRVIRGEVLKAKELEYVQAGRAMGFGRFYILVRHVLPNTSHLMFIQFSLLFIAAIKSEVILTFLGLGLKEGASWGLMISQSAPEVVNGLFWQIGSATAFMLVLVLAFNVVSDALQDAFDPKHVG